MQPLPKKKLNNRYFLMRHGESHANKLGIIVSAPEIGVNEFGLTGNGTEQVVETAVNTRLDSKTIIYCSDFCRTRETAEVFSKVLDVKTIVPTEALRERHFGDWDGSGTENYARIWQADETQAAQEMFKVEHVNSVAKRALTLVDQLESTYQNETLLLVSHGDTLQILMTAFSGACPSTHRRMNAIKTAEIRALTIPQRINASSNKLIANTALPLSEM